MPHSPSRRPNAAHLPGFFTSKWLIWTRRDPCDYATPFPRIGFIKRTFIRLSGIDPALFEHYDVGMHTRGYYAGMGATVLIPAAFAFVCAMFTISSVLGETEAGAAAAKTVPWMFLGEHTLLCVLAGLGWATIIMRMDVSIMATMHKWVPSAPLSGPAEGGKPSRMIWRTLSYFGHHLLEIWVPLIRLTAAGVLGVVMSHCLVLLIFHVEIDHHIDQDRQKQITALSRERDRIIEDSQKKIDARHQENINLTKAPEIGSDGTILSPTSSVVMNTTDESMLKSDPQGREIISREDSVAAELATTTKRLADLPELISQKRDEADRERFEGNADAKRPKGEGSKYRMLKQQEQDLQTDKNNLQLRKPLLEAEMSAILKAKRERISQIIAQVKQEEKNRHEKQLQLNEQHARVYQSQIEDSTKVAIASNKDYMEAEKIRTDKITSTFKDEIDRIEKLRQAKKYGILERSIHLHQMIFPAKQSNAPLNSQPVASVSTGVSQPAVAPTPVGASSTDAASPTATVPEPPEEAGSSLIAQWREKEESERGEMMWLIWVFTLGGILVLDITPVLLKLLRPMSVVDIVLQRLNEEALRKSIEDFRAPELPYDPDEDPWNNNGPTTNPPDDGGPNPDDYRSF